VTTEVVGTVRVRDRKRQRVCVKEECEDGEGSGVYCDLTTDMNRTRHQLCKKLSGPVDLSVLIR
jgi:hypothetical protein